MQTMFSFISFRSVGSIIRQIYMDVDSENYFYLLEGQHNLVNECIDLSSRTPYQPYFHEFFLNHREFSLIQLLYLK